MMNQRRVGFSLVELVAVLAVAASMTAVLGPSISGVRTQMRGVTSVGNLSTIGQAGAMYAIDNDDRISTFTWRRGELYTDLRTGNTRPAANDAQAAAWQVRDILYRATGRLNGAARILSPQGRLMHRRYSHLVLADYMGGNVSDPMWADPADANLLNWQLNPLGYIQGDTTIPYLVGQPDPGPGYDAAGGWRSRSINQLWAFSSSYQTVPHAWQSDFGDQYVPIESTPHLFMASGNVELGDRRHFEVVFPSAKVHMFEEFDREQAGSPYFGYDHARSAKLMFDGSINTMASGLSQRSVSPADYLNGSREFWDQTYVPLDQFPIPLGGLGDETLLSQRFRWTLGGLRGVNYPTVLMKP